MNEFTNTSLDSEYKTSLIWIFHQWSFQFIRDLKQLCLRLDKQQEPPSTDDCKQRFNDMARAKRIQLMEIKAKSSNTQFEMVIKSALVGIYYDKSTQIKMHEKYGELMWECIYDSIYNLIEDKQVGDTAGLRNFSQTRLVQEYEEKINPKLRGVNKLQIAFGQSLRLHELEKEKNKNVKNREGELSIQKC